VLSMGNGRTTALTFVTFAVLAFFPLHSQSQAALLMEQPYGFFGMINPTGHNAIYLRRVCAETPVKLRRCQTGEMGAVIARYEGIDGYDWLAIPLVPYLYAVENPSDVPARVNRETVARMRNHYHEAHLLSLGTDLSEGTIAHGGWKELIGSAYERRIYAFRFETTEEQDDAFIARMNARSNRSHFEFFYNNCADFSRKVLNSYLPGTFRRNFFPDAGMTTPKQTAFKLERYARKHPETQLEVFEIPQIPGYRHFSHPNHDVAESLSTTGYAIPIALLNPYIAGGLFVDYLVRGHYHVIPRHPLVLGPENLSALTASASAAQNPDSDGVQAPSVTSGGFTEMQTPEKANSGLIEKKVNHE
jgi:hypothetical protein